jgi:hypothetical protein
MSKDYDGGSLSQWQAKKGILPLTGVLNRYQFGLIGIFLG